MTFSDQAADRAAQYSRQHRPPPSNRTTCVPESLRDLEEFQELAAERAALLAAADTARQQQAAWAAAFDAARAQQLKGEREFIRACETAIEEGEPLPEAEHIVRLTDISRPVSPYVNLSDQHWQYLHAWLDAEERSRVIAHGQEPVG